jgi:hypothetical protein
VKKGKRTLANIKLTGTIPLNGGLFFALDNEGNGRLHNNDLFFGYRIAVVSFAAEWLDVGLMENRHNMMRGCIVVLDLIGSPSSKQSWPFHERRAHLEAMFGVLPAATRIVGTPEAKDSVLLIPSFSGPDHLDGLRLYRGCIAQNEAIGQKFYEGVVAKRADSLYPIQLNRPKAKCPDWIKHRFDQ